MSKRVVIPTPEPLAWRIPRGLPERVSAKQSFAMLST